MFVTSKRRGYDRSGQQLASGLFLCVFHHNQFKWADENGLPVTSEPPKGFRHGLYACVRNTSLKQLGHWMMGTVRIAGQSVTISGSYGGDGLPMDYEKLTPKARAKLVPVPYELCMVFWKGGGWNCTGSEGPAMQKWAKDNLKRLRG